MICFKGPDCHYAHSEEELRPIARLTKSATKNPTRLDEEVAVTAHGGAAGAPEVDQAAEMKPAPTRSRWKESTTHALRVEGVKSFASWKLKAVVPSSSISTTSSSQSRLSEPEDPPTQIATPVTDIGVILQPPASQDKYQSMLCHGIPCQHSIELALQQRTDMLALGIPVGARAIGLPVLTIDSVEQFLAIPYDL